MSKNAISSACLIFFVLLCLFGCGQGGGAGGAAINVSLTAKAGLSQDVIAGNIVALDGSQSTGAEGGLITYQWSIVSKPDGSAAAINDPASVNPTFRADLPGQYVVKLVVTDAKSNTSEDSITVTVTPGGSAAPVAKVGAAQNVITGAIVTLDGSNSSAANGEPLTYSWTLTSKPAGSAASLSSAAIAKPSFTADVAGSYTFNLIVSDGRANSSAATVTVTAFLAQMIPVADAGAAQSVITGNLVTLDGSNSTAPNSGVVNYSWAFTSRPAGSGAALSSPTIAKPTFTADVAGSYLISLIVNDGAVSSTAATVTVTADTLTAITISPSDITVGAGQNQQYLATGIFQVVGSKDISTVVSWASTDPAVATINSQGLATVAGEGTTGISAVMAGISSSATLTVGPAALLNIRVDKGPIMAPILAGQTLQLKATANYSDKTKKDVTELASWAANYAKYETNCLTVSDSPGTKGLVGTKERACYEPVSVSYAGMKNTAYVTVK